MPSASFAPLRHRSFRLALLSSFVSSTGTWMQSVAMGVYLQTTTHNAAWLGLVTMAAWLPSLVASPLGGALADRLPREKIIQISNVVMAATATTLAAFVLGGRLSPLLAVALALVEGFASSSSWASWQSLLRDLVATDEVVAAVALSSAQFNLGRVLGPLAAGAVLAWGSPGWCFALNAASFVFVVAVYAFVRSRPRTTPPVVGHILQQIRHGARTAWSDPRTRNPIVTIAVVAFFVSPFIALIPTMAIEIFHAGPTGTSWLVTAQGVGAVLGAVTLPALARRTSRRAVLEGSLVVLLASVACYGLAPSLWWSVGAMVVVGGAYIGTLTSLNSSVQLSAPSAERSRILSLYTMSLSVGYPVGAQLQGLLVRPLGLRAVTLGGVIALALLYLAVRVARPQFVRAMGDVAA